MKMFLSNRVPEEELQKLYNVVDRNGMNHAPKGTKDGGRFTKKGGEQTGRPSAAQDRINRTFGDGFVKDSDFLIGGNNGETIFVRGDGGFLTVESKEGLFDVSAIKHSGADGTLVVYGKAKPKGGDVANINVIVDRGGEAMAEIAGSGKRLPDGDVKNLEDLTGYLKKLLTDLANG